MAREPFLRPARQLSCAKRQQGITTNHRKKG
jgi:hypothetical protein